MIFKNLFKAKWQNKDANVRLSAIADDLSVDNVDDNKILRQLANNDDNDNVRKAALIKLNDIELWLNVAKQSENKADQQFAVKQLQKLLKESPKKLEQDSKIALITLVNKSFLEEWLLVENELTVVKAIYEKLAKPQTTISLFARKQDEAFQLYLLASIDDKNLLEKLIKKTDLANVQTAIDEKLSAIEEAEEKPIQLSKAVNLTLSKLLALKESKDNYQVIVEKRKALEQEWLTATQSFDCLSNDEQQVFNDKFAHISSQLNNIFIQKEEAYQQDLIAQKLADDKKQALASFEKTLAELEQTLANAVFQNIDLSEGDFKQQLSQLVNNIELSILNANEQNKYLKRTRQLADKLEQLPAIAQSVTDATHLISKVSQLAMPASIEELNDKHNLYQAWLKDWQQVEKQSIGTLPDSIKTAKNEIVEQWQQGLADLLAEQKQYFNYARKNIADLKRLIASGKYNPCFGIYKKLQFHFNLLSDHQKQRLQRDFDNLSEKINELSDWEHYIATPKKQELLAQIQALVTTPLDNPNEQANKVKTFRKQWNSLGHAEDDVEKTLNDEFNQACEQAFAPCRQFYAEQEKIRAQHAVKREGIIEQATILAASLAEQEPKAIEGQLNKLNKAWRAAGDVDREEYQQLYNDFKAAIKPIKDLVANYHQQNIEAKQALITKAKTLVDSDNAFEAANTIKTLQNDWRNIGYSGAKTENQLWQTFREINDQVFAQRDAIKTQQIAEQDQARSDFEAQITALDEKINQCQKASDFHQCLDESNGLISAIVAQKPVIKSVIKKAEAQNELIKTNINQLKNNQAKQDWQNIFAALEGLTDESPVELENIEHFQKLPDAWKKRIASVSSAKNDNGDRLSKTLELEILGGIESPKEFSNERLAKQVDLMQQQMLSGGAVDLSSLFIDWLQQGKFTSADKSLLARIKPLYC